MIYFGQTNCRQYLTSNVFIDFAQDQCENLLMLRTLKSYIKILISIGVFDFSIFDSFLFCCLQKFDMYMMFLLIAVRTMKNKHVRNLSLTCEFVNLVYKIITYLSTWSVLIFKVLTKLYNFLYLVVSIEELLKLARLWKVETKKSRKLQFF